MRITDIYKKYKIMPQLQAHHYRVAAVAWQIIDKFESSLNLNSIITACLLHDMGNIIKFNLKLFPEFNEPEGYEYWKSVQDEFMEKYGNDEHIATSQIGKELGIDDRTQQLLESVGLSESLKNCETDDMEIKITAYADFRVGMHGIRSLEDRLNEGRERFNNRNDIDKHKTSTDQFEEYAKHAKLIEEQIFEHCKIRPEDITDQSIKEYLERLRNFELD